MDDSDTASPLDEAIVDRIQSEYNNEGQLSLGYFQEFLSDIGPDPSGLGAILLDVSANIYIMFQALTSWTSPFTGADKVTSGNPATGIELGFNIYGACYFELYLSDIDNQNLWDDLRAWNELLTSGDPICTSN